MKKQVSDRVEMTAATITGAVIGMTIAHFFNVWWAYILGLFVGGSTSYLCYRWKQVIQGIKIAWTKIIKWKPNKIFWKNVSLTLIKDLFMIFYFFGFILASAFISSLLHQRPMTTEEMISLMLLFITLTLFVLFTLILFTIIIPSEYPNNYKTDTDFINSKQVLFWMFLPIAVFVVMFLERKVIILTLKSSFQETLKIFKKIKNFIKEVFLYIHSRKRLICMIGAVIGIITSICLSPTTAPILTKLIVITVGGITGAGISLFLREVVAIKIFKIIPNGEKE